MHGNCVWKCFSPAQSSSSDSKPASSTERTCSKNMEDMERRCEALTRVPRYHILLRPVYWVALGRMTLARHKVQGAVHVHNTRTASVTTPGARSDPIRKL